MTHLGHACVQVSNGIQYPELNVLIACIPSSAALKLLRKLMACLPPLRENMYPFMCMKMELDSLKLLGASGSDR